MTLVTRPLWGGDITTPTHPSISNQIFTNNIKNDLFTYNTSNDIQNFHDPSSFHSPFKHCQRSSYDQLYHLTVGVGMTNDDIRQFSKRQTLETDHHKSNLDLDLSTHLLNTSHAPPTTSNNSSPSPRFLSTSKDSRSN